jgi:glycerol-3-phosphate acyltransferase PlsY
MAGLISSAPFVILTLVPAILGYLLGSIPFGLVLTRLAGLGDIRAIGSGNIGATNVLRTGRKDLALATLLLDAGKAGLAYWLAFWIVQAIYAGADANIHIGSVHSAGLIAGAAAFIGHCYPVWLKFKGGKGVATYVGLLLAAIWPIGLIFGVTWLAIAAIFRMSSLAGLTATLVAPIAAYFVHTGTFGEAASFIPGYMTGPTSDSWIVTGAIAVLIFYRHADNIRRLLAGTESKIGAKKETVEKPTE